MSCCDFGAEHFFLAVQCNFIHLSQYMGKGRAVVNSALNISLFLYSAIFHLGQDMDNGRAVVNSALNISLFLYLIITISNLSNDRSKASSKTIPPHFCTVQYNS